MRKQQILKLSLTLSVFSIFIFSFTYFGVSAFGSLAATNQAFSEKTYIGNVDVSNQSHEEAQAAIEAKVSEWAATAELNLVYKGQTFSVNPSSYIFLIEDSIAAAANGTQNELFVEVKEGTFKVTGLPDEVISNLKKESLLAELQAVAQGFIQATEISLEKYLPAEEPETISTASVVLPAEQIEVKEIVEGLPIIEIGPETQFSFEKYVVDAGMDNKSSSAYSQIASAIYMAIMPTNFTITERHIGSQLPENIDLGFEAKVDIPNNKDLKFFNPNKSSYNIELNWTEQQLQVILKGAPLLYEYKITTSDKQEFKPRTIKQYSPLLNPGQKSVEKEGEPGYLLKVNREIYGQKGELLETESISEDFYPPVYRIEILPVAPAAQQTTSAEGDSQQTEKAPAPELNNSVPGETADTEAEMREDSSNEPADDDASEGASSDDERLWGKPNEQPK